MKPTISSIDISIVIPAKDEERRLPRFLDEVAAYCRKSSLTYEVIVVDDGSQDATAAVVDSYATEIARLSCLRLPRNCGKGNAVKQGLWRAQGRVAVFLDADGSTPVAEIEDNLSWFDQGYDIIIGSRVLGDGRHTVKARWHRRMMGKVLNGLVHICLFKNIQDSQCGFKMFRQEIIRPLFSRVTINGFGFDLEMLYLASKLNFHVKEVPVNWHHVEESKIHLWKDSLGMLVNIFQIPLWHSRDFAVTKRPVNDEEMNAPT